MFRWSGLGLEQGLSAGQETFDSEKLVIILAICETFYSNQSRLWPNKEWGHLRIPDKPHHAFSAFMLLSLVNRLQCSDSHDHVLPSCRLSVLQTALHEQE